MSFNDKLDKLESPIERLVFERLSKFKHEDADLIPQYEVATISGFFRPDLVLCKNDCAISVECDGKEFHKDTYYDEWRDAMILISSDIRSVFRLRGKDIHEDLNNIVYLIAQKEPDFFDMDLIARLKSSVRPEFINRDESWDCVTNKRVVYDSHTEGGSLIKHMVEIVWRNIEESFDPFYLSEILTSYLNPHKSIKDLIDSGDIHLMNESEQIEAFYKKYPNNKKSICSNGFASQEMRTVVRIRKLIEHYGAKKHS